MKLTASEFISKAEGLKSSEMNVRQRLESIRSHRQRVQSAIATQQYRLQSLYLELEALESEESGDDEDEEGTDNSAEIAAVMAEISSTQESIEEYEQQDAELRSDEMEANSELRSIEQQEQETLAEIQDSAARTNQNIALISSFGGDYANVSAQATGSFQHNLGQLSQAAQILGGNVAMGASGSGGGSSKGGSVSGGGSSGGTGSGRNFYEAANNQRKTDTPTSGSMGAKGPGASSTGRNGKDLYGSDGISEEEAKPKKSGGFGRRPGNSSKQTPLEALANYMHEHHYGRDDFATYSQDPEWRVLQKAAYPDYKMPPLDPQKAFGLLSQYMASHNFGPDDYATYSKDPIWKELHDSAYPDTAASIVRKNNSVSDNRQIRYNEFGVQSIESVQNWIKSINPNPHNDPRRTVNCGKCAAAVFMRLNGNNTASAGLGTYSISEMNHLTGKKQTTMTPEQIRNYLISQGPGSHAVVGVDRASGAGHWFNAYYDGYQVYTIEGQGGEINGWPPDYGNVVHWDVSI